VVSPAAEGAPFDSGDAAREGEHDVAAQVRHIALLTAPEPFAEADQQK